MCGWMDERMGGDVDGWMSGWMDVWMSARMDGWMDDWMHDWVNVCVRFLLVVDLLGLWRGVKPVSL